MQSMMRLGLAVAKPALHSAMINAHTAGFTRLESAKCTCQSQDMQGAAHSVETIMSKLTDEKCSLHILKSRHARGSSQRSECCD